MFNFKYIKNDIRNNKIFIVLFIFINILAMFLFVKSSHIMKDTTNSVEKVNIFRNKNAYIIEDNTSNLKIQNIISDETSLDKMGEYFKTLYDNDIIFYTQYGYEMHVSSQGNVIRQHSVTNNFFDLFNINIVEGRLFIEEEYNSKSEIIPVVIGYELASEFELGHIYPFDNGGIGESFQGKVVGVLEKNSIYYELNYMGVSMSLDNSYIIPLGPQSFNKNNMSFSDFDMAITRTVIFGEDNLNEIEKAMNKMDLFEISLSNVDDKIEGIVEVGRNSLLLIIVLIIILLALIVFITVLGFNRLIKKQLSEFGIHMLCGATAHTLIVRFALLVYSIILLSIIFVSIYVRNLYSTFFLLILGFLLGFIVLIYPYYKLTHLDIAEIINKEKV